MVIVGQFATVAWLKEKPVKIIQEAALELDLSFSFPLSGTLACLRFNSKIFRGGLFLFLGRNCPILPPIHPSTFSKH